MTLYSFIEVEKAHWPVRELCRTLEVSRSAWYEWRDRRASIEGHEDTLLKVHIKAIHRQSRGSYGRPRMHAELLAEGFQVGEHRVGRLMADLGISGLPRRRGPRTTTSDEQAPIAENILNRQFTVDRPNQAWVGDITYLRTQKGWVYLSVLIDLFSRKVVGWAMADHMETSLCLRALEKAIVLRQPPRGLIHHTDRGSQYTSRAYRSALSAAGMTVSMSRKGNCWDNAVSESFFGTVEQELVRNGTDWQDLRGAEKSVGDFIHSYYNGWRRHSANGYKSPCAFETLHRNGLPHAE